jgi:hypothetical protein
MIQRKRMNRQVGSKGAGPVATTTTIRPAMRFMTLKRMRGRKRERAMRVR